MSAVDQTRVVSASDSAVFVEFGEGISESVNRRVYAFAAVVRQSAIAQHVVEMVPSYRALLIEYDYMASTDSEIRDALSAMLDESEVDLDASPTGAGGHVIEIPVVYGGSHGPDLPDVAENAGLTESEVVGIHSGTAYRVFMVGFAPGFPYLGGMDERIACPRLTTPRVRIPAGSVGIAESQTGLYPNASAGGWRIIGRSPAKLFDVDADPPSVLEPGANVRFVSVESADFDDDAVQ